MKPDLSQEPLFIADREEGVGIIVEAEIKFGKATGQRYIALTIDFGGADNKVFCTMGRIAYTVTVIRNQWPPDDEKGNIAKLVNMRAKVRWTHEVIFDGKPYVICHPIGAS